MNKGTVKFFNKSKGFGFILMEGTDKDVFVHISGLIDEIQDGDNVTFDTEETDRGTKAINVKIAQ